MDLIMYKTYFFAENTALWMIAAFEAVKKSHNTKSRE
jgi:hypothetical protein